MTIIFGALAGGILGSFENVAVMVNSDLVEFDFALTAEDTLDRTDSLCRDPLLGYLGRFAIVKLPHGQGTAAWVLMSQCPGAFSLKRPKKE